MATRVVMQAQPLVTGAADIPAFNRDGLIKTLRVDQARESTFQKFPVASWRAGVVQYDVDFEKRTISYYSCNSEEYVETYAAVAIG